MEWEQPLPNTLVILNSCHGNGTGTPNYGNIPIRMPIGSRLISVDVVTLDSVGPTSYVVELNKSTLSGSITHFGNLTLGASSGLIHTLITLPGTEIVAPDASYAVRVGRLPEQFGTAFCQVTVAYDTKP